MRKINSIEKVTMLLVFVFSAVVGNAQVSDVLLTTEMNNGNNTEAVEITLKPWKMVWQIN